MQPCRRKSDGEPLGVQHGDFLTRLAIEKKRCERHNRFFALFGLSLSSRPDEDMMAEIQAQLRASDYVFTIPVAGGDQSRFGVLLSETDPQGARVVKKRLTFFCGVKGVPFQIGLAVYPDDATTPEQLLACAFNGENLVSVAQNLNLGVGTD